MKPNPLKEKPAFVALDTLLLGEAIKGLQKPNGEIPWSDGGKTDPWDHVEAAMGLSVAGFIQEAEAAYLWSARTQMRDGSFYAAYQDGMPTERRRDPNMTSYLAVGVYHHYLVTGSLFFLKTMWPAVSAAIDFTVGMQAPDGEIYWSLDDDGNIEKRALLTGSSSIYLSLKCALAIAARLHEVKPQWEFAARKLGSAVRGRHGLFDASKSRYSMDWYYPILAGALTGSEARERIEEMWDDFVVDNWGVKCVSDRPWITMAESSELVLALYAAGLLDRAEEIFSWIRDSRYPEGLYWTGVTYPDSVIWPEERTSWTTAAVLLAGDALYNITGASALFSPEHWERTAKHGTAKREANTAA